MWLSPPGLVVLALVALTLAFTTAEAEAPVEPLITNVEAHLDRRTLSIDGRNLSRMPVVTLSRQPLSVIDAGPHGITVELPPDFRPRTYLLTVETSSGISRSLLFNLTVASPPGGAPRSGS